MFFVNIYQYLNNNKNRDYRNKKLGIPTVKKLIIFFSVAISANIVLAQNFKLENNYKSNKNEKDSSENISSSKSKLDWENLNSDSQNTLKENIKWEKIDESFEFKKIKHQKSIQSNNKYSLSSLNRSIVFDDYISGPDISWIVPPGLPWNGIYAFDNSVRGYSRRKSGEGFLGFNGGDAVGQFYYQFLRREKYSFGVNLGVRSVYDKEKDGESGSPIGDGLSSGFRFDYKLSDNSGFALGGEQLLHFDGMTDTGRDIYATFSKGWWKKGGFPLHIATFGLATGKMAEGNIKGLCSDLLGGSGTEIAAQRSLCWAPVFSISRVYNTKHSTFFEYNSKYFLLGQSFAPFDEIPIRGTFAVVLSDHVDNYKIHSFEELTWVFRIGIGF